MIPSRLDAILRQGRRSQQTNPGNIRLNYFLEQNLPRYDEADKKGKGESAMGITANVQAEGGLF